jgi:hypothetical protein
MLSLGIGRALVVPAVPNFGASTCSPGYNALSATRLLTGAMSLRAPFATALRAIVLSSKAPLLEAADASVPAGIVLLTTSTCVGC